MEVQGRLTCTAIHHYMHYITLNFSNMFIKLLQYQTDETVPTRWLHEILRRGFMYNKIKYRVVQKIPAYFEALYLS